MSHRNSSTPIDVRRATHGRANRRRGVLSLLLLFALTVLLACCALAVNIGWLAYDREQTLAACESAALAGVGEMFERSTPVAALAHCDSPNALRRLIAAQDAVARRDAMAFASINGGNGRERLALKANWDNSFDGDLVTGWVENPTSLGSPLVPWDGRGRINSLRVRAAFKTPRSRAFGLWLGQMLGIDGFDSAVLARATVDQRVYGFRPVGHVRVPLLPLLLLPVGGTAGNPASNNAWLCQSGADHFRVNEKTGEVTPGADGISEFTVRVGRTAGANQSHSHADVHALVMYLGGSGGIVQLRRQILDGLDHQNLEPLGGQITQGTAYGPNELRISEANAATVAGLYGTFSAIRGEKRVWPVGQPGCDEIASFVTGTIVDCRRDDSHSVTLVVQPCVVQTCTALVGPGVTINPWIGKVTLTQ